MYDADWQAEQARVAAACYAKSRPAGRRLLRVGSEYFVAVAWERINRLVVQNRLPGDAGKAAGIAVRAGVFACLDHLKQFRKPVRQTAQRSDSLENMICREPRRLEKLPQTGWGREDKVLLSARLRPGVDALLASLTQRERRMLSQYFGLDGGGGCQLQEVEAAEGVCRNTVTWTFNGAIAKLRTRLVG